MSEPIRDIAHLGHVEILTPKPDESLTFFRDVLGMEPVHTEGESVYLRGWGDHATTTLKLTAAKQAGLGHVGWRAWSPEALDRRVDALGSVTEGSWIEADYGHGRAYRFADPDGHPMEVYYEEETYSAPDGLKSKLKNQPMRYPARGVSVNRLDHVNLLCSAPAPNRSFMEKHLGFRLREQIMFKDGTEIGDWMSVTQLVHDIAYVRDATGQKGRLHHAAFWLDNREDILRAADILVENDIFIETGPAKHAITQAFFLYFYEPGGNRIELFAGGYLIFAPDWKPIIWDEVERGRGVHWGGTLPESFRTYGTP